MSGGAPRKYEYIASVRRSFTALSGSSRNPGWQMDRNCSDSVYNVAPRMKTPSTTLIHALIGKSILETLLVGALALFGFMSIVPPYFHGWGELTDTGISGWVVNNAAPWERVEVQLFVAGKFVATTVADQPRPDVLAAGWSKDQWHGYTFLFSSMASLPPGLHEAKVYALHDTEGGARKSLQLVGDPVLLFVDNTGKPGEIVAVPQK